jgi:hypothetical protein
VVAYVALLREAVRSGETDWEQSPLETLARASSTTTYGPDSFGSLADQVAYDRALMSVCQAMGIATSVERFDRPATERARLEQALAQLGPQWKKFLRQ